jgi:hypothetical protein
MVHMSNTNTTTGADNMSITATPTSARLSHEKVTDNNHVSHYVFLCADGKYGNNVVGFGYATVQDIVAALSNRSSKSEWLGIARGVRSGKI